MPRSGGRLLVNALGRVGLRFSSLLVAGLLFSALFSLIFGGAGSTFPIFRITMTFALPVGCLYLPVLIALGDEGERRVPIIILGGVFIGPASMALWGLFLEWSGGNAHTIWYGDPLTGVGGLVALLFAFIVGSLTTVFYVLGLKVTHRRSAR
jgi:hypothetical protein